MQPSINPEPQIPWVPIVAIVIALLWSYVQMRHWREPEADFMPLAINLLVTLTLWAFLMISIFQVRRMPMAGVVLPNWFYLFLIIPLLAAGGLLGLIFGITRTPLASRKAATPEQITVANIDSKIEEWIRKFGYRSRVSQNEGAFLSLIISRIDREGEIQIARIKSDGN